MRWGLAAWWGATLSILAQGIPEQVILDSGGGATGITAFELHGGGVFWWKSGANAGEVLPREGTLGIRPTLGLSGASLTLFGPATRYLGRGYGFRIGGADHDGLFVYYSANGYLRKKPLASLPSDALDDANRVTVLQPRPPFGFSTVPVEADGAVLLHHGALWYSVSGGGSFSIRQPGGLASALGFSAAGFAVKRMAVAEVVGDAGARLKDVLLVLTTDGLLYRFDFDPYRSEPTLMARNVGDFAFRRESFLRPGAGGVFLQRVSRTLVYAAVGDVSNSRGTGRLLVISLGDGSVSTAYDTGSRELQVRGVAADDNRLFLTVTPLRCGGVFGCSYDEGNSQVVSRVAPADSSLVLPSSWATIADRTTSGGVLEGFNLRSDGRWVYWVTGNGIWRLPADSKPIERDFAAMDLEVVQTTQDLDNTTRLVAGKSTVVRAYARVARDSLGRSGYALSGTLRGYLNGVELPGSPLRPANLPTVTATSDLSILRATNTTSFLFEVPSEWMRRGRLRVEFTVNPALTYPETGVAPLANNTVVSPEMEVIQMGSPCLVFVPIHTAAPNYDPRAPGSGFAEILDRARSLLPVDQFRFALKADRISKPVPVVRIKHVLGIPIPYPAIDYQSFVTEDGFDGAIFWLKVYSTFERDPEGCPDTHYVGTVHAMANTGNALGLATRPATGVAQDLVVKMEPPGAVPGAVPWVDPRGGQTLAHELGHNYTLRHVDHTVSPLRCGTNRPAGAGPFPGDTCSIGILNAANLNAELARRTTPYGYDPLSGSIIPPQAAADFMSYRWSSWLSKYHLDLLFGRIPGFQAPADASLAGPWTPVAPGPNRALAGAGVPIPPSVILVGGRLNRTDGTMVLETVHRLPAGLFDPVKLAAGFAPGGEAGGEMPADAPPAPAWAISLVDANGVELSREPLRWLEQEDARPEEAVFLQFLADDPAVGGLRFLEEDRVLLEKRGSTALPELGVPRVQAAADGTRLSVGWEARDPDGDALSFVLLYSPDDGGRWMTLQAGYPHLEYVGDARWLPGGDRCRLRVIGSDGFHSVVMDSEPFRLPRHGPELFVGGVEDGAQVGFGEALEAKAYAYDAEDGSLPGTAIRWELQGRVPRTGSGHRFALGGLPPGAYDLRVTVGDADGNEASRSLRFEILPLQAAEGPEPVLDGECADPGYAQAPVVRLELGTGNFVPARLIHAQGRLYACATELGFGSETAPAHVGLRVASAEGGAPGFFVDEAGIPFTLLGTARTEPRAGFAAAVVRGVQAWSAELRIEDALLGGWGRPTAVQWVHGTDPSGGGAGVWPPASRGEDPASWSSGSFGEVVTPRNRPPRAVATGPQVVSVRPGDRIWLDGTGSRDPEGHPLSHFWTQIDGPAVDLQHADRSVAGFTVGSPASSGIARFRLVVSDGELSSEPADWTVSWAAVRTPDDGATDPGNGPGPASFTVTLQWPGSPGDSCTLQGSADLRQWTDLGSATVDAAGRVVFQDLQASAYAHRFYRAVAGGLPPGDLGSGTGLRFPGASGTAHVRVPHQAAQNAYPLTLSFWMKTTNVENEVDGLVGKYEDASLNGYAVFLYAGHVRAWYFGAGGGWVWDGDLGLDGGFVADGAWHQITWVVDASGGRLFVDGVRRVARGWEGSPGPSRSTDPLQFGRYSVYPEGLDGQLDEVVLRVGAPEDVEMARDFKRRLTGREEGLVGYWRLDEGRGDVAGDATGRGGDGVLVDGPEWVPTGIPLEPPAVRPSVP